MVSDNEGGLVPKKSRQIRTSKPRPFLCDVCARGFVRQEHLKRHLATHTNEKPYGCRICGKCFTRRDLIIRHQQKLHFDTVTEIDFDKNIEMVYGNTDSMYLLNGHYATPAMSSVNVSGGQSLPRSRGTTGSFTKLVSYPTNSLLDYKYMNSIKIEKPIKRNFSNFDFIFKNYCLDGEKLTLKGEDVTSEFDNQLSNDDVSVMPEATIYDINYDTILRQNVDIVNENSKSIPTLQQFNTYIANYKITFEKIHHFIHLQTFIPTEENFLLIVAIANVGASYSQNRLHVNFFTKLITNQLEAILSNPNNDHQNLQLWVVQTIVLQVFVHLNDGNNKNVHFIKSQFQLLIKLTKITKLYQPLNYERPFEETNHFQYFILAQSRIRTCHFVYLLATFYSTTFNWEEMLHSIDIKCGVPCLNEELFDLKNEFEWNDWFENNNLKINSQEVLNNWSNGYETFAKSLKFLASGNTTNLPTTTLSTKTLISLLMTVHEKNFIERKKALIKCSNFRNDILWRIRWKPLLSSVLNRWKLIYTKNDFNYHLRNTQDTQTQSQIFETDLLKSLYWFAKIKESIDISPVLNSIMLENWEKMNVNLEQLHVQWESLKEASSYCLSLLNLWILTNKNGTKVSSPMYLTLDLFVSILIIAEFTNFLNLLASSNVFNTNDVVSLSSTSCILFWRFVKCFSEIEEIFIPNGYNSVSYCNFTKTSLLADNFYMEKLNVEEVEKCMKPYINYYELLKLIKKLNMPVRCLYLGTKVLMHNKSFLVKDLFIQAIQIRATYLTHVDLTKKDAIRL